MVWKASEVGFRLRFTVNGTKDLPVRAWTCPMCEVVYDWDMNTRKEYAEKGSVLVGATRTHATGRDTSKSIQSGRSCKAPLVEVNGC